MRLTRWTIDLAGGVNEERLDDRPAEFPRLDERYAGLPYRCYAGGRVGEATDRSFFNGILLYDHKTGQRRAHDFGLASFTSEPIFVPRTSQAPEGDGFLLAVVYRQEEHRSDMVILDAQNIEDKPLATVILPHRIPYGFHGNWGQGIV